MGTVLDPGKKRVKGESELTWLFYISQTSPEYCSRYRAEQLSQHPGQCCVRENSDILLSLSLSRGENMHSSQLEHKPTIPVNKNLKCLKFNSFLKGIAAVRVLLSVLSTCSHIIPAHYVTYITTMETFNTIKTLQRVCWKSFFKLLQIL